MADLLALVVDVAGLYDVTADAIKGRSRDREVNAARQHVMYLLVARGETLHEVGRMLDRDHTTVLHGVRVHCARHELPLTYGPPRLRRRNLAPAGPVRTHLRRLVDAGMTRCQVAVQAGVSERTVRRLLDEDRRSVMPDTAGRLLAVTVEDDLQPSRDAPQPVCEDCGAPSLGGGRWCGVGRCKTAGGRWSWSGREAA